MPRYLAITGGVGGAKLALGLSHLLDPAALEFIVNTGDDFVHLGVHISPDLDTLMYTLAGLSNEATGWGRAGESWQFMESFAALGGENWFNLGDRDFAVHVRRTGLLDQGLGLDEVTLRLYAALGVAHRAWPMSNDPVATRVETTQGELAFQHYFVRERCAPAVRSIRFAGSSAARATPGALAALRDPELQGVIICPSNPYLSVDPILAVTELRIALGECRAPVIAVSPLVAGEAIKGPTAKIMAELGLPLTAATVAQHYAPIIDGLIVDERDRNQLVGGALERVPAVAAQTVMRTLDDKVDLAHTALHFLDAL